MNVEDEKKENATCVVFDGQCPFCRVYVASLDSEAGSGHPALNKVDARSAPELVEQLADKGIDINTGIVFIKDGAIFQDSEALTLLAKQHAAPRWLVSLHHRLLRYSFLSLAIYPILRALRNVYLRLARQSAIETGINKG